jgi:hypothetical protein
MATARPGECGEGTDALIGGAGALPQHDDRRRGQLRADEADKMARTGTAMAFRRQIIDLLSREP